MRRMGIFRYHVAALSAVALPLAATVEPLPKKLKKSDEVELTCTEAVAISVEPAD